MIYLESTESHVDPCFLLCQVKSIIPLFFLKLGLIQAPNMPGPVQCLPNIK
jgi:hypothetical protein